MTTNTPDTTRLSGERQERMPLSENDLQISLNVLSNLMSGSAYHWHVARLSRHIDTLAADLARVTAERERLRKALIQLRNRSLSGPNYLRWNELREITAVALTVPSVGTDD